MKKYLTLALLLIVLAGACDNGLFSPGSYYGSGNVHIKIGSGDARSILPSQYDLSALYYKLIFTNIKTDGIDIFELDGETALSLELDDGWYDLTIYGYINQTDANADTGNNGIGALFWGTSDPFKVTKDGNVEVPVVMRPYENILKQTAGKYGTLKYEIIIPQGATGTLTIIEENIQIALDAESNIGQKLLQSGDYEVVIIVNYDEKVKVRRAIAQIYDNAISAAKYVFAPADFINAASVAITNVIVDHKIGNIEIDGYNIAVSVHPDLKPSLNSIAPSISFTGVMIAPIVPQDFSGESPVKYTIYAETGESAEFYITIKIATVDFERNPGLRIEGGNGFTDYTITKPEPDADTLTLYYAKGKYLTAEEVKNAAGVESVLIMSGSVLSGTLSNLENNQLYSFVVEAEKEHYRNAYSIVRQVTPSTNRQLSEYDFDWTGGTVPFTGDPQPITINATAVNGANTEISSSDITIYYNNSTTAPTNAGTYSISISVEATETFAPANLQFDGIYEITPIAPEVKNWPIGLTAVYGQKLADIDLSSFTNEGGTDGVFAWDTPNASVGSPGTKIFAMTFTPNSGNYFEAYSDVSVTVNKAYLSASDFNVVNNEHYFDDTAKSADVTFNNERFGDADAGEGLAFTVYYGDEGTDTEKTDAGSYAIRVEVTSAQNFNTDTITLSEQLVISIRTFTSAPVFTRDHIYTTAASASSASTTRMIYSFEASNPPADEYWLYYVSGNAARDTAWLLNPANNVTKVQVPAGELSGTITVSANTNYSLCIVAEKEHYAITASAAAGTQTFNNSPNFQSLNNVANQPNQLIYQFAAASGPTASQIVYTLFYIAEETTDINRIITNGTPVNSPTSGTGSAANRTFTLAYNTTYSYVIRAVHTSRFTTYSVVRQATTGAAEWVTPQALQISTVNNQPKQLSYQITAASPTASTYKLYYIDEEVNNDDAGINYIIENGTVITNPIIGTGSAADRILSLDYNKTYSFVVVAQRDEFEDAVSTVVQAATGNNAFTSLPTMGTVAVPPGEDPSRLRFDAIGHSTPTADIYTVYYTAGNVTDVEAIVAQAKIDGFFRTTTPTSSAPDRTIPNFDYSTTYSFVVEAARADFPPVYSAVVTGTTGTEKVYLNVDVKYAGDDAKVIWSFKNGRGVDRTPTSDIILTYTYTSGLEIVNGKLTTNITSGGNGAHTLTRDVREYTIISNALIGVQNVVVTAEFPDEILKNEPLNIPIELMLYNKVYNKASEYGAIELFSHARNYTSMGALGPTTQARQNIIVNYDPSGVPINFYSTTGAFGHGGISGAAQATQHREWYYDGSTLYGRSNGGATNLSVSTQTGATAPLRPAPATWNNLHSMDSAHITRWNSYASSFRQNPFGYIAFNVNKGYTGLYEYKFADPTSTSNNLTSGRSNAPSGITGLNTAPGALAHNANGTFEFTIKLDSVASGNEVNIEYIGNVEVNSMGHSSVTFVIDEDMRFVKFHSMDVYGVADIITATTYTCGTYYFVYHKNNIVHNNHATYRGHQTRPNHVNYCDCTNCDAVLAPEGNVATGNWVVANSRYEINLNWTNTCTTTVSIP